MRCTNPIMIRHPVSGRWLDVPCGQCISCRLKKAREWSIRIMNECSYYEKNCFLTLTYDEEHLPSSYSISKRELQLFLKKLRKKCKFRYFGSGEYGDKSMRPHYHIILFGVGCNDNVFKNRHYSKHKKGYLSGINYVFRILDEKSAPRASKFLYA